MAIIRIDCEHIWKNAQRTIIGSEVNYQISSTTLILAISSFLSSVPALVPATIFLTIKDNFSFLWASPFAIVIYSPIFISCFFFPYELIHPPPNPSPHPLRHMISQRLIGSLLYIQASIRIPAEPLITVNFWNWKWPSQNFQYKRNKDLLTFHNPTMVLLSSSVTAL